MALPSTLFAFPAVVNETAARLQAGAVAVLLGAAFAARQPWIVGVLAAGFLVRVLLGPRYSPLARAVSILAPRMATPRPVAGSPKRFAQGIGATLLLGSVALFLVGDAPVAWGLALTVAAFATLEALFAFCLGCRIYGGLQRLGLVSPSACVDCAPPRR